MQKLFLAVALVFHASVFQAFATEPLVGTWHLERQEVNGEKIDSAPLTMEVSQTGAKLAFAFSVLVNHANVVSMTYELQLDGKEADVKDAHGETMGTIEMAAAAGSATALKEYKLLIKRPNRRDSAGKLSISADGKTLTSEADTLHAGKPLHTVQIFLRQ
jgi:hypothetical protein